MSKKKILVVEDEADMRTMLALELETSGYEVFQAGDGEAGFKLAEEVMPDLIVADVMMPKMDGNQLLKKLRAVEKTRDIPFIVLTARGKMRDYFEAMEVDEFISKPFDADDLLLKIKKLLEHPRKSRSVSEPPAQPAASAPSPGVSGRHKKVLIVENDLRMFVPLENTFKDYGYQVKVVGTPARCLEELSSFHPDIVVTKYLLEEINADKMVGIIRGMPHYKNIPVIVYSKTIEGSEQENSLKEGATDFMLGLNEIRLLKRANELLKI